MSKPLGIAITIGPHGPSLNVTRPSRWEDKIYDAVQEAICANVTVEQFRLGAAEAWRYEQSEQMKSDAKAWSKP